MVGRAPTGLLHPKQCATLHVQASVPAQGSEGLWYLGAVIDSENTVSEVSEANNGRVGNRVAIGSGAELVVARVSAPASTLLRPVRDGGGGLQQGHRERLGGRGRLRVRGCRAHRQ